MPAERLGVFAASLAVSLLGAFREHHRVKPFDLVEGHEHLGVNSLINRFYERSVATVTRCHTAYHSLVSRDLERWPKSELIRRLEEASLRSADCRVTASAFIASCTAEDFPAAPAADEIIPLFARVATTNVQAKREPLIIFAGRMVPTLKNPAHVAVAFSRLAERLPEWRVEFAGPDVTVNGESTWAACERVLSRFPGRYRYHGALDPATLAELYRRAAIVVLPSRFESFGLVALEAMSAGCVPVVTAETALAEVVGHAGVIVPQGSLDRLTDEIAALIMDSERRERLSQTAMERSTKDFSHSRTLARNMEMFETVLQAHRKRRGQ